jgi:hypothetical protein
MRRDFQIGIAAASARHDPVGHHFQFFWMDSEIAFPTLGALGQLQAPFANRFRRKKFVQNRILP